MDSLGPDQWWLVSQSYNFNRYWQMILVSVDWRMDKVHFGTCSLLDIPFRILSHTNSQYLTFIIKPSLV
jgi:hypothetical protein